MANNNNPNKSSHRRGVFDLQNMLYVITMYENDNSDVIPDGVLGPETTRAISKFQENAGLTINGTLDLETWNAISERYNEVLIAQDRAGEVYFFAVDSVPDIKKGEKHDAVLLAQLLFSKLADQFNDYYTADVTGNFDELTELNVKEFQRVNNLDVSGDIDRKTWDCIAKYYSTFEAK